MNGPNLHTLYSCAVPLYVECRGCHHRAALTDKDLPFLQGNMTMLKDIKLRCRTCGSRDVKRSIPFTDTTRGIWLDGATILMRIEA